MENNRVDPCRDSAFKYCFSSGDVRARKALAGLLGAIFGKVEDFSKVTLLDKEALKPNELRRDRFDLVMKTEGGRNIDIEMQRYGGRKKLLSRAHGYGADMVCLGMKEGMSELEYPDNYVVMIVKNSILFPKDRKLVHRFRSESGGVFYPYHGRIEVIIIELRKYKKTHPTCQLDKWIVFFKGMDHENSADYYRDGQGIREAEEMLQKFSQKEIQYWERKERAEAERERREDQEKIFHAGEKKGVKKNMEMIVRRCLTQGYPVGEIARITGLEEEAISALGM